MYRSVLALLFASVLLLAYFYVIDPTVQNRQGNDRGSQYQTGVYFTNESARETVKRIAEIKRGRSEKFFVEIGPLKNFYPAEEYHQNYLEKNPNGYCHIPRAEMELFSRLRIDPGDYQKPAAESIRDKLTAEQYRVTPESGTERAFTGEFWDKFEKGIYVDVVTGEPLFSSTDKYESGCGWPAFTKPIEGPAVVEKEDLSHGMRRTEVRSRAGDSHLGHVFTGDPESPNGVRYCINSAALRFVPYEKMETEGYGYLGCFLHLQLYYSILKASCMFEFQQGGLLCKNICLFCGTAPFLPGLPTMRFCPSCTASVQRKSPDTGAPTFSVPEIPRRSWGLCCPAPPL